EEMRHHLDALTDELVRAGATREHAAAEARRRFGSTLRLKEAGHDVRRTPIFENVWRDIRHMVRGLRRSPAFAITVILTLAIGIGGNTTIFSVIDQVLLRPLPYPDGDRLVLISTKFPPAPGFGPATGAPCRCVSTADWLDWQRENSTLEKIAIWFPNPVTLTGVGDPVRLNSQAVSGEFFPVLGVRPLLGRTITADDDRPNHERVVVISYSLWQRLFNGDPKVVGRIVQLNGPTRIIGVMPATFRFVFQDNDVWLPFQLDRTFPWRQRAGRFLDTIARRKPDVTQAQARTDMERVAARLASRYEFDKGTSVTLTPLRQELTGQVHTSLVVLYGAVAVLLAIACFNVANLLLVRASARGREIAVRTSLGAGRASIVRQLVVESLLLAVAGGAVGIALAYWSIDALTAVAPPNLLRVPQLTVDTRVLLYAVTVSLLTGIACGVVPAVLVGMRPVAPALRAGSTTITHAPRVRQALVISQVAMTVILLCGAGLLSRTLFALSNSSQPLDKHDLLTMQVALPPRYQEDQQRVDFFTHAIEALRAIPGVQAATAANSLPIIGSPQGGTVFHRQGTPELPPNQRPVALIRVVTPGYFRTLGIPVTRGREFIESDPATAGFVVNEAFVRAYLAEIDPLGQEIKVEMQAKNPYLPIIGVVADVSEGSIRNDGQPTVFYSEATMAAGGMAFMLRTSHPQATVGPAITAIHRLDSRIAVTKIATFEDALADSVARDRLNAIVSGSFAFSGLMLAALGVYGLLTFMVAERTKEMAIRIVLGAHIPRLTRSVVARGLALVAAGSALGLLASLLLLRSLKPLLFAVTPYDAPTYISVIALLCGAAVVASYMPARHAGRVEPLRALREE
ncbi:MAG TPA: ABC transporter permease, partial [Vicinamibacterales bacterium]|nr:ABC transporter permease [Vicinamibacterales bacterium]